MDLTTLRHHIDQLDSKIVALLNERAEITKEIGLHKIQHKKAIYAPDREKQVLDKVVHLNKGPMKPDGLKAIYREIMSAALNLEKPLKIAYMGPEATFSHLAALKRFGSSVDYVACDNVSEVFGRVQEGSCDYGVVPIENSIEGVVSHTMDMLVETDLTICSQVLLDVAHNFMVKKNAGQVKVIYSHPQVFGQCRTWLQRQYPQAELVPVVSTTKAAQLAAKQKNSACIASSIAAVLYGLTILHKNIQDSSHNITRFLVLSTTEVPPTGKDRTSIVFSIKDKVGALHGMLAPFVRHKINLTKIESRPSKKKAWDYYFFVDCEGHKNDKQLALALKQLEGMCKFIKILGSYPIVD